MVRGVLAALAVVGVPLPLPLSGRPRRGGAAASPPLVPIAAKGAGGGAAAHGLQRRRGRPRHGGRGALREVGVCGRLRPRHQAEQELAASVQHLRRLAADVAQPLQPLLALKEAPEPEADHQRR